ncbi:MAG: hypothetical protein FWH55_07635 [Oscillospiraceae bacterium]|nr:hypothetical protein [Oscillospiraceae bacterium]
MKRMLVVLLAISLLFATLPVSSIAAPQPLPEVGNIYLQENLEKFPDMFDYGKNQTKVAFSNDNSRVIMEEVFIEVPCDVDKDGKRDLIHARIRRPIETRTDGLKTPVIAGATPYITTVTNQANNFGGKVDIDFPGANNPDTQNVQYSDIVYEGPRYKDLLAKGFGDLSEWGIPDARTPLSSQAEGVAITGFTASGLASYMIPLGYSYMHLSIIGSNHAEGFLTYGGYEENLCVAAMVDWLNGRLPAYTDLTGTVMVEPPYWATGEVAMYGTSYEGTLPFAGLITGVEGLKAIVPIAPVTSSYEYYRANGGVYAPGGWQGEDVTFITNYTFGRGYASSGSGAAAVPAGRAFPSIQVWENFFDHLDNYYIAQDRTTGDYNAWWDERNQAGLSDDVRDDVGVIMMHGFNDDNVKFKQSALINEAAKKYGFTAKGIFHQGMHTSVMGHAGIDFYPRIHYWLDHYLYGVENGMPDDWPEYLVQSNVDISWKEYDEWPAGHYKKLYPSGAGRVGTLATTESQATAQLPFKDIFVLGLTRPTQNYAVPGWAANPAYANYAQMYTDRATYAGHVTQMAGAQYYRWRNYMLGGTDSTTAWTTPWTAPTSGMTYNLAAERDDRLLYVMDIDEDLTISGTIKMTAKVKADKNVGTISAMLVDFGSERRYGSGTTTTGAGTVIYPNGTTGALSMFSLAAANSPARIISRGSVDVQNPNYDGTIFIDNPDTKWMADYTFQTTAVTPGEFYPYTWEMDVSEYELLAGHKLALMIYGTDPEYTIRPFNATEFTVEVGPETYLSLPVIMPKVEFVGSDGATVLDTQHIYRGEFIDPDAVPAVDQNGAKILGWIDMANGADFDLAAPITQSYRLMPKEVLTDVQVSASVLKQNGNKNELTITLIEVYSGGTEIPFVVTFSIDNNAADTYDVAGYKVYVDTKGNTQIRACYVVY